MKFIHTGDLHIGRGMHEFDLLGDQEYMLSQILAIAAEEKADGLIVAGDVYDRSMPSAQAVEVFDRFLTAAWEAGLSCYIISGNHDSGERLSFAGKILEQKHIYIGSSWKQGPVCVRKKDVYGDICIWMLPFARPAAVKAWRERNRGTTVPVGETGTMQEAEEYLLSLAEVNQKERNVLITHTFVTNDGEVPQLSDSEQTVWAGGIDSVTADCFAAFDYTALGHLHGPQRIGGGQVWYAGSPLKYSFSEALQEKGVLVVELKEKGTVEVSKRLLSPLHDVRRLKGTLKELMSPGVRSMADPQDYISAVLTDEGELLDPMATLRGVYPNICEVVLEKRLEAGTMEKETAAYGKMKTDEALFEEFYEKVTGKVLDEPHREIAEWMRNEAKEEAP